MQPTQSTVSPNAPSLASIFGGSSTVQTPTQTAPNANRPSLDSIFNNSAPTASSTTGQTNRPSLSDIFSNKASVNPTPPAPSENPIISAIKGFAGYSNNVLDKTSEPLTQAMTDVNADQDASTSGKENALTAGKEMALHIMKGVVEAFGGALDSGVIQPLGHLIGNAPGMDAIANSKYSIVADTLRGMDKGSQALGTLWNHFAAANPTAAKNISDAGTVAQFMALFVPETPEAKQAVQTVADTVQSTVSNTGDALKAGAQAVKESIPNPLEEGQNLLQGVKEHLSEKNVEPQLETSASRMEDPSKTYDSYVEQAKAAVTDVKKEPPLATVGEDVGNSFQKVSDMRKQVGKTMGDELKTFANEKVPLEKGIGDFQQQLLENGSSYDALDKRIVASDTSKFSTSDNTLLEKYGSELQKLGNEPTAAQLDAFISRMPKEIEGLKSTNAINFPTNAERIINGNLNSLRESLGEVGTPKYNAARQSYSELSKFMEEGRQYLGKTTQSGDFAKDSSLIKSSVQSMLNNGKKDWLVKLEGLTGNNLLDKTVMALQAMKDAGDTRGTSLLQTLSENVPHTGSGFVQRLIDWGINKTKGALIGSPEEQTRTFLQSLANEKNASILDDKSGISAGMSVQDITSKLTPHDTELMQRFIDDVRAPKTLENPITKSEEATLTKMNELLGINQDLSAQKIATKYEEIVAGKKKK